MSYQYLYNNALTTPNITGQLCNNAGIMNSYETEWRKNNPGARGPSRAVRELSRVKFGWEGRNLFRLALLVIGVLALTCTVSRPAFKECEWRFNNPDPKSQLSQLKQWVKLSMG